MKSALSSLAVLASLLVTADAFATSNVLVIIADDVGVDSIRGYKEGKKPPPTPNIDKLAKNGVMFKNAWASAVCSPTRACVQTGRYGFRNGVGNVIDLGGADLAASEWIIPELLDANAGLGYSHAMVGKWHLGEMLAADDTPNDMGWGYYAGTLSNVNDPDTYFNYTFTEDGVTTTSTNYATTETVDKALGWVGQQAGPWVMIVAFNAGHTPFHAPPAALHSYKLPQGPTAVDDEPIPFYKAMVEAMDTEIGRLLAGLGDEIDDTTVIFMGDNGTPGQVSEDPFAANHAKGTPFEGGINVPLIIQSPLVKKKGRKSKQLVHAVDVFATVMDICGISLLDTLPEGTDIDGVSLVPFLLRASDKPVRTTAWSELYDNALEWVEVRNHRYKLVRITAPGPGDIERFFDLKKDPFENNELLGAEDPLNLRELANYRALKNTLEAMQLRAD